MSTKEKESGLLRLQCHLLTPCSAPVYIQLQVKLKEPLGSSHRPPREQMRRAPLLCRSSHPTAYLGTGSWGGVLTRDPQRDVKARSGAVRTAKVLSVKVRGVCGVRAQERCVNSRVKRVCAHGGRASWRRAMRSARSGWAREGRRACSVPRVGVPEQRGGADARSVRGPGFRAQGEGLSASVPMPRALVPAVLCGWAGVPTHPGFRGGDAGPTPGSTSAPTLASRSWLAQEPGRPLLRHPCSVAGRSSRAGAAPHGSGAPRGPAVEWSSAAVRARSQEPAARSLALARPLACSFLNLK